MSMWIRSRLDAIPRQGGFSVVELLVVIIVIGLLSAVAVPSYMGLRERANNNAARSNVEEAVPAVDAYRAVTGAFTGMTLAKLQKFDEEVTLDRELLVTRSTFCIQSTVGGKTWSLSGPGDEDPEPVSCSARS